MSFWNLSNGESAATGDTDFEIGGGNFKTIPDGSSVLAYPEKAAWDRHDSGEEYIALTWKVTMPQEYAGVTVKQKLYVSDDDPSVSDASKMAKKRDKAKRTLAAIDANCGGRLARKANMPTDDDLTLALTGQNKVMTITVKVWEMDDKNNPGETVSGNWICAVASKTKGVDITDAPVPEKKPVASSGGGARRSSLDDEDSVPF